MEGTVGLCASCAHARAVVSGRGATFWLCGLSAVDARSPKYPRLPVLRCPGFVASPTGEGATSPSPVDPTS
ncbi:MAG TPA: hypothetical protein VN646_07115 [Candidatus Acidoferrum sp.]|nr:hypothetical protein [Candidatus Acidoferrum sp.]